MCACVCVCVCVFPSPENQSPHSTRMHSLAATTVQSPRLRSQSLASHRRPDCLPARPPSCPPPPARPAPYYAPRTHVSGRVGGGDHQHHVGYCGAEHRLQVCHHAQVGHIQLGVVGQTLPEGGRRRGRRWFGPCVGMAMRGEGGVGKAAPTNKWPEPEPPGDIPPKLHSPVSRTARVHAILHPPPANAPVLTPNGGEQVRPPAEEPVGSGHSERRSCHAPERELHRQHA